MKKVAGVVLVLLFGVALPTLVLMLLGSPWWAWILTLAILSFIGGIVALLLIANGNRYGVLGWSGIIISTLVIPSFFFQMITYAPWWGWLAVVGTMVGLMAVSAVIILGVYAGIKLIGGER